MTDNITVKIIEQPGGISQSKANALAELLTRVIYRNPEIDKAVKERKENPNAFN
jgi:hypothetical protein